MKKSLFFAGALLASCFTLTSCSGGGDGDDSVNVGAMSGRTFILNSPSNGLGAMIIRVGDRIGSSNSCDARFSFGGIGSTGSSPGSVKILSTVKSEEPKKSWDKCEFTFQIYDAEISEEVNFKAFFAIWSGASTAENTEGDDNNNGDNEQTTDGSSADSYVIGLEPVKVSMTFESNNSGNYRMDPTTVYLDDQEEVVQTTIIQADFLIQN